MPIKSTLETSGVPVHIWTDDVDENSKQQLRNTASLPCVFHHVAAMPDVHFGIGATVGSVIATKNAVIPAAVGVDIGCGMMAAKLPLTASQLPDSLKALRTEIEWSVPVGFNWHKEPTEEAVEWHAREGFPASIQISKLNPKKIGCQLGTLGGGNHFVEVCLDAHQHVWIMLHSGSRGIGNDIAKVHIETAKGLFAEHLSDLADPDLAYLAEGTPEFAAYWRDLQWAQAYAKVNREIMMTKTLQAVAKVVLGDWRSPLVPTMSVNCFRGDTKLITSTGVKTLSEVAGGKVRLITSGGEWVDADVKSFGEQRLVKLTMQRYEDRKVIYTTAAHRWFVDPLQRPRIEKTTSELRPGDRLAFQGSNRSFEFSDTAFEFRGFTFGDGSMYGKYKSCALFCGPKLPLVKRFAGLCGNAPRAYPNFTRISGLPGVWKKEVFDIYSSTPNEIFGWLAGYFAADGDVDKTGRPTITSVRLENLETYRDLCWLIGISTHPIRSIMRKGYGAEPSRVYLMGLCRNDLPEEFFLRKEHRDRRCNSCSHGAGRRMSRTQAKKQFTEADLIAQTAGVECRKDAGVIDEIPSAYKPIQEVMDNQPDLVEIVAELHQVVCVKG